MSVELESKNRIANLISAANAKTGGSDTDLTTAVGSLIAGFGQGGVTVYHYDGTYADFIANRETVDAGNGILVPKVSDDVLTESDLAFREFIVRTSEHPSEEAYDGEKYWRHCPLELVMQDGILTAMAPVYNGSKIEEISVMSSISDEMASEIGISAGTYMYPFLYSYEFSETLELELCKFEFYFMYGSAVNEL